MKLVYKPFERRLHITCSTQRIPMIKYLICFILLSALTATAQTPMRRVGDSCPTGTYRSGDYCKLVNSSIYDVIGMHYHLSLR